MLFFWYALILAAAPRKEGDAAKQGKGKGKANANSAAGPMFQHKGDVPTKGERGWKRYERKQREEERKRAENLLKKVAAGGKGRKTRWAP